MLSIAELAHQRDPQAIAEVIRRELQALNYQHLHVEVAIIDSNLELQIRTDSAIDKEKLLTLISSNLQNLHIESVAKFKVQYWRDDDEIGQRLLWMEQVMLEPLHSSVSQNFEIEPESPENAPIDTSEVRVPETHLSKESVLRKAISKLSREHSLKETPIKINHPFTAHLDAPNSTHSKGALAKVQTQADNQYSSTNDYWQLVLVGLLIMLLGLGIGAFVRTITTRKVVEPSNNIPATSSSNDKPSNPQPTVSQNLAGQSNEPVGTSPSATKSNTNLPDVASESTSKVSESNPVTPNSSANNSQTEENLITLDKFNLVQKGMTVEQVEKIFGVSGKVIAENTVNNSVGRVYSWKNPQGSNAIIEFKDGQVVAKAQAGL
ncbi:MAG: hypothetical protein ACKPCM_20125 [Pseudanabaena sp.]